MSFKNVSSFQGGEEEGCFHRPRPPFDFTLLEYQICKTPFLGFRVLTLDFCNRKIDGVINTQSSDIFT